MFIVNKYNIIKIILPFIIFLLTLYISPFFVNGDQYHYNLTYNEVKNLNFIQGFFYYHHNIASFEPVYYIIINLSSEFISRVIFIALSNAFLAYLIILYLERYKVSITVIIILILTNYYLIVLYFSAERLKFAFLFLFLALLAKNYRNKTIILVLSVTTHIQMFILFLSLIFKKLMNVIQQILIRNKMNKKYLFYFILSIVVLLLMQNQIICKFNSYFHKSSFTFPYKILIFFSMTMLYTRNKLEVLSIFFVLFVAILFLGEGRINIFGYCIFLYYALQYNRGINIGIFLTSSYYTYQTILFVNNIFLTGDGYAHFR
jgi:hypothetical protein